MPPPIGGAVGSFAVALILSASLVLAVLLSWQPFAAAQDFSQQANQKAEQPANLSMTGLLGTDAEIDKEIDRVRRQVDELRAKMAAVGAEAIPGNAAAPGQAASPGEGDKRG